MMLTLRLNEHLGIQNTQPLRIFIGISRENMQYFLSFRFLFWATYPFLFVCLFVLNTYKYHRFLNWNLFDKYHLKENQNSFKCCAWTAWTALAFLSDVVYLYKLYQVYFGLVCYFLKPLNSFFTWSKTCLCLGIPAGFHNLSVYSSRMTVPDDLDMLICHTETQTLLNINNWLQWVSNSALLSVQCNDSCCPIAQTTHNAIINTIRTYVFFLPVDYTVKDGLWTICDVSVFIEAAKFST